VNDTVSTKPTDAEPCDLSWCQQSRGNQDNHVRLVGLVEPTPWSDVSAVVVSVQAGQQETAPLPVIGVGSKLTTPHVQARMTWAEFATMARLLADAERRYG
jgi:hypothetical protein